MRFFINNVMFSRAFTKTKIHGEAIVPTTIGVIEDAMQSLKPRNPINVRTISRFVLIHVPWFLFHCFYAHMNVWISYFGQFSYRIGCVWHSKCTTFNFLLFLFITFEKTFHFDTFRTDTGVHALNSAVVVDLERMNGKPYDSDYIISKLNESFEESKHQIRVNQAVMVPNTFNEHINAVKSRTYLYRLGVIKPNKNIDYNLDEKYRCFFIYSWVFSVQSSL